MRDYRTRHDYTEHGQKVRCHACDALFRRSRNGAENVCRWCRRPRRNPNERPDYDDGLSVSERRDLRERPWRLREPAPQPAAAAVIERHPAGCLCGMTPNCVPF